MAGNKAAGQQWAAWYPKAIKEAEGATGVLGPGGRAYRFADAKDVQCAHAVGVQGDTRSHVGRDPSPFDDRHLPADPAQADRRGQPAYASPDHHRAAAHALSGLFREFTPEEVTAEASRRIGRA